MKNKLKRLQRKYGNTRVVSQIERTKSEMIDDLALNFSSTTLNRNEMELPNRGLKFVILPVKPPREDLLVDIMAAVDCLPDEEKDEVNNT